MNDPGSSLRQKISHRSSWVKGTASRVFLSMLLALLPLAVLATISNIITLRTVEKEKLEFIETATEQNASQLLSSFHAILTAQGMTANVLASDPNPGSICQRVQGLYRSIGGNGGIISVIFDSSGTVRCASPDAQPLIDRIKRRGIQPRTITLDSAIGGVLLQSRSRNGGVTAWALYRTSSLRKLANPGNHDPYRSIVIESGGQRVPISAAPVKPEPDSRITQVSAPIGDTGLSLIVSVTERTSKTSHFMSLAMPLVLLLGAAFFAWLVVQRVLIVPLAALRREVAAYVPGTVMYPPTVNRFVSHEIKALGDAFHDMSEDVATHENEMREALSRQTQLTREVHHRVKNNLQIISSMISLHWRAADNPTTGAAYLSIQRRVDALAVVQRHHYAEMNESQGVRARPMLHEIASGLKTSAQVQSGRDLEIAVECDDVHLNQDVAAPIAFMTAELADLVIAIASSDEFRISLVRDGGQSNRAHFRLAAPVFKEDHSKEEQTVKLYERVLVGLARQLRTPLEHDVSTGSYQISVPILR